MKQTRCTFAHDLHCLLRWSSLNFFSVLAAISHRLVQGVKTHRVTTSHRGWLINRPGLYALIYTTSLPDMFVYKILSVALAFLGSALRVSCSSSYDECPCTKPAVRREWRAFSTEEKAEWIRAIKVRIYTHLTSAVLLKHIRNSVLVTTTSRLSSDRISRPLSVTYPPHQRIKLLL
jgi:hypothetical protein